MDNIQQLPFECIRMTATTPFFLSKGQLITINDQFGISICTKGHIKLLVNKQLCDVKAGNMLFYSPLTSLHILNISDDLEALTFRSSSDFIIPIIKKTFNAKNLLLMPKHPCITLTQKEFSNLNLYMIHLSKTIQEFISKTAYSREHILGELIKSLAETLCFETVNIYLRKIPYKLDLEFQNRKDTILQNFIFSLYHNYNKEREVSYYANEQCISSRYFSTIIKEVSGKTALEWIIQMVIVNAKQLLEYSNASIKEIAMKLNFPTQSFFGRYFKQYVGISPKEYRKNVRLHVY